MTLGSHSDTAHLRVLTRCTAGQCPTIYETSTGDIIVQGYEESMVTPDGERAVRIPRSVFLEGLNIIDSE